MQKGINLKLASAFGLLANLAEIFHRDGLEIDGSRYARAAFKREVIALSSEPASMIRIFESFPDLRPGDTEILVKMLMRTGRQVRDNLPQLFGESQRAVLGDDVRVQLLLDHLLQVVTQDDKDHDSEQEGQGLNPSEIMGFLNDSSLAHGEDSRGSPEIREGLQVLSDIGARLRALSRSSSKGSTGKLGTGRLNGCGAPARAYN